MLQHASLLFRVDVNVSGWQHTRAHGSRSAHKAVAERLPLQELQSFDLCKCIMFVCRVCHPGCRVQTLNPKPILTCWRSGADRRRRIRRRRALRLRRDGRAVSAAAAVLRAHHLVRLPLQ